MNLKGLYRRGLANMNLQNYIEAETDFNEALLQDPENKAILTSLSKLKQELTNQQSEKNMYIKNRK